MLRGMVWLVFFATTPVLAAEQDARHSGLEAFFSDLGAAAQAGDRQAYISSFAPDAAMFLPHRPPLIGRTEIGDWAASFFATLELHLDSYEQRKIEIVGDVATVRSHASGHYLNKKSGQKYPLDQKYLDVVRYVDDEWQVEYHVASSNTFDSGVWELDWESEGNARDGSTGGSDSVSEAKEVVRLHERHAMSGNLDGVMSNIADDAVFLAFGVPLVEGKAAFRDYYEGLMASGTLDFGHDYTGEDLIGADIVILRGVSRGSVTSNDGTVSKFSNNFIHTLRRGSDGRFKFWRASFAPDATAPLLGD